jgi:predicted  nucleic acid-binding Zn-ribbon protein
VESEALRNIRTLRQIKSSLDVARGRRTKTTNCLFKKREETERLEGLTNGQTSQVLAKEKTRSAAYAASLEKSRQRLLKSREKLATLINRNRALTNLRHELQQARWKNTDPDLSAPPPIERKVSSHGGLREIELRY